MTKRFRPVAEVLQPNGEYWYYRIDTLSLVELSRLCIFACKYIPKGNAPVAEPVTVGILAVSALAIAAETVIKGAVSEAVKDGYKALKERISLWAVVAEAIDSQSVPCAR